MPSNPLKKRKNTHDQVNDDINEIHDSDRATKSKYWFEDGNVILQAENVQFRVHRSLLARHSNVFKDMFDIPQPANSDNEPRVEGFPIIRMQDSAHDVEYIISIFYDNIRHDMREPMECKHIAAMLRLGKKYEIDHIRDEGLLRLRTEFPNTLKRWDNLHLSHEDKYSVRDIANSYITLISLAHELQVETILPSAYLALIQTHSVEYILRANSEKVVSTPGTEETRSLNLPQAAVNACLTGRDKLLCIIQKAFLPWFHDNDALFGLECALVRHCRPHKAKILFSLEAMTNFHSITAMNPVTSDFSLCAQCEAHMKRTLDKLRTKLWDSVPSIFGLPDWEDLRDFDQ